MVNWTLVNHVFARQTPPGTRIAVEKKPEGLFVAQTIIKDAEKGNIETAGVGAPIKNNTFYPRVKVTGDSTARFSFSEDGVDFKTIGDVFAAKKGKRIGTRIGVFSLRAESTRETGYADINWFRVD